MQSTPAHCECSCARPGRPHSPGSRHRSEGCAARRSWHCRQALESVEGEQAEAGEPETSAGPLTTSSAPGNTQVVKMT